MARLNSLLLLLCFALPVQAQDIFPGPIMRTLSSASFVANTAVFDGTNDRIVNSSALTAVTDGKAFTCSFWLQLNGGDGANADIFVIQDGSAAALRVRRNTLNVLSLLAINTAAATILNASSSVTLTAGGGWVHVYIAIDLANAGNRHIYFNGVEDGSVTWTTYSNDTIDLATTTPTTSIGAFSSGINRLNGALAELWWNDAYLNDTTKFYSAGDPISLGANGQTPTGAAPAIYLSQNGSGDSWAVDSSGNGNTFTVTGALGTTTPP